MQTTTTRFVCFSVCLLGCGGSPSSEDMALPDLSSPDLASPVGNTGDPCESDSACLPGLGVDKSRFCRKETSFPIHDISWPGGYCEASCNPEHTDPATGVNSDCPGPMAGCRRLSATQGACRVLCDDANQCRSMYGCFQIDPDQDSGCEPQAFDECDVSVKGSCPQTMGPATCVEDTTSNYDFCAIGCDPFATDDCPGGGYTDCHASDLTGVSRAARSDPARVGQTDPLPGLAQVARVAPSAQANAGRPN